jgi:hypothetical protein
VTSLVQRSPAASLNKSKKLKKRRPRPHMGCSAIEEGETIFIDHSHITLIIRNDSLHY